MQFGFSTLGEPGLSWDEASLLVDEFGLDFLELRALRDTLDLPGYFGKDAKPELRKPVQMIGSSLRLTLADQVAVEELMRFAGLAARLRCPYVRVFGGGVWGTPLTQNDFERARAAVALCRAEITARQLDVTLLLETHSAFSDSASCLKLNEELTEPLLILWDSHHTWRTGGEAPAQTWSLLGPWIRHIHYKDSVTVDGSTEHRYVLPGLGEFPTEKLWTLLEDKGFQGGISLEWEKIWHPELPPLREALAAFRLVTNNRAR